MRSERLRQLRQLRQSEWSMTAAPSAASVCAGAPVRHSPLGEADWSGAPQRGGEEGWETN